MDGSHGRLLQTFALKGDALPELSHMVGESCVPAPTLW
ncbi:hypothetical protein DB31_3838 [Hyalangium minutum]|uniref:Uncharacterized protein n=1 Tax=Hyalangium minutum TaxID=394096 RepID=A0A085W4W1_9BACT|nr:hypothetical protein DB31_3838 [Hyalangium minutum]